MQVSVYDHDSHEYDVIDLDTGKRIKGVQWADDSSGVYEVLCFDKEGNFIIENGDVKKEFKRGNIEIRCLKSKESILIKFIRNFRSFLAERLYNLGYKIERLGGRIDIE